jgi:7,8-dihydropterin-6-yl-methyl-4-(beta-D-ribofuranosyl)aminobenzene 5'-phosphate synthase
MKHFIGLTGLCLILSLSTSTAREPVLQVIGIPDGAVHVTIIYDNYQENPDLKTDWGFACLVEYLGNTLLFDAGRNADLYKKNVGLLEIKPEEIPTLFISHEHGDHTAGIPWICQMNPSIQCYLPATFAEKLRTQDQLPSHAKAISEAGHLSGPFYSTGENFAAFKEQGLVIKTETGGVLITGCGHPGAIEMVRKAQEELGIEVHTVIGGLHLMSTAGSDVNHIGEELQQMGIKQICPTHCTGDKSIASLKASFGDGYISGGTGKEIVIQ